jgi:hypothetical protein
MMFPSSNETHHNLLSHGLGDAHSRREFLRGSGYGIGGAALAALLSETCGNSASAASGPDPLARKEPHFPATAKRIIHLFMAGAPSQLELFDEKPLLREL